MSSQQLANDVPGAAPLTPADHEKVNIAAMYDSIGPRYETYILTDTGRQAAVDKAIALLKPPTTTTSTTDNPSPLIVDLGCASGRPISEYLLSQSYRVIGIDLSPAQIASARARLPGGEFIVSDFRAWDPPSGPGSVDGVVSFYALPHLPEEQIRQVLARIRTWLRKGGVLALGMVKGVKGRVMFMGWEVCGFATDLEGVQHMVREAGFVVREAWEEEWRSEGEKEARWKINQFVVAEKA